MKVNKFLLAVLSIFLILLVFVSSASAADSNETQVLSDNNDGIITATNNEDNLTMEEGTYKDVVDLIGSGGGDITLERKLYKYDAVSGGSTITISSRTTIDGNGAILDMAGSNFQVFFLDNEVTIKNLTIKNAHTTG